MNMTPELSKYDIAFKTEGYTNDTNKVVRWLTANGSRDGIARENISVKEGLALADKICVKNIPLPSDIEQALKNAIVQRSAVRMDSVLYGSSSRKALESDKTHHAWIKM